MSRIDWARKREQAQTEDVVENHLVKLVKSMGGASIKVRFMRGFPDRVVLLPGGTVVLFELKRPVGGEFEPLQLRWHNRLRELGFQVHVCNTKEAVDQVMDQWLFS